MQIHPQEGATEEVGLEERAGHFFADFYGLLQTNRLAPSATQPLSLAKGPQATMALAYQPTQAAPRHGADSFVPETARVLVHFADPSLPPVNVAISGFGVQ